uniref:Uncharacterized protein n=1 Tax=Panagrellus redivivus TaxID=6233 RepID=A0A7E4ZQC1_PANRE
MNKPKMGPTKIVEAPFEEFTVVVAVLFGVLRSDFVAVVMNGFDVVVVVVDV